MEVLIRVGILVSQLRCGFPQDQVFFHDLYESKSRSVVSVSLRPHGLYSPWNSPGQNTGMGSLSQPNQPRDQTQVFHIANRFFFSWGHQGSPRILESISYPFSRASSWPMNWTRVSCIAGRFFTNWAMREARSLLQKRSDLQKMISVISA